MKAPSEPMSLHDVAILLKRASEVSNHRRFVIAGSLVATGAVVRGFPSNGNRVSRRFRSKAASSHFSLTRTMPPSAS